LEHKHYATISPVRSYSSRIFSYFFDLFCTVIVSEVCLPQAGVPVSSRARPLFEDFPERALERLGTNLSSSPSLASHALKTSSWALAVSNLKLLSILIPQIAPQRHNIFSTNPAQLNRFTSLPSLPAPIRFSGRT
jgi:hypothetical protein